MRVPKACDWVCVSMCTVLEKPAIVAGGALIGLSVKLSSLVSGQVDM